jgi:hypothetical protein
MRDNVLKRKDSIMVFSLYKFMFTKLYCSKKVLSGDCFLFDNYCLIATHILVPSAFFLILALVIFPI